MIMIYSMTGFGRAEQNTPAGRVTAEIKTVNNRYLEYQIKLPRAFALAEQEVALWLKSSLGRGTVTVSVYLNGNAKENASQLSCDFDLLAKYVKILQKAKKTFKLEGDISINTLASLPGIYGRETGDASVLDDKKSWEAIKKPLAEAMKKLLASRKDEGKKLENDIRSNIKSCLVSIDKIKERAPERLKEYRTRLEERVKELTQKAEIDKDRIAQEIAIMADRLDISEECVRFQSHIEQFTEALTKDENAGRRLNFVIQEMHREANTIGSKANDAEISGQTVYLKEYIEKIREQIQNIE